MNPNVKGMLPESKEVQSTQLRPVLTNDLPNSACVGCAIEQEKSAKKC